MEEPQEEDDYDSVTITTLSRKDKGKKPEKEAVTKKTFQIDKALKESAIVETSENNKNTESHNWDFQKQYKTYAM